MSKADCIDHGQSPSVTYGHSGTKRLHRLVFERTYGYLPEVVMHTCDNPRCINPDHLVAGTIKLNNQDCSKKGRNNGSNRRLRKLTQADAEAIREDKKSMTYDELEAKYPISRSNLYNIIAGKTYK